MEDGQQEAERRHCDQSVNSSSELKDGYEGRQWAVSPGKGIYSSSRAQSRNGSERHRLDDRFRPCVSGDIVKERQQCCECKTESGKRLGKGDAKVRRVDSGQCWKPEIRAKQHSKPPQSQADDRGEILYLFGPQQARHPGPQQKTYDYILGTADIAEPISQAVEDEIGKDVTNGNDRERCECCLHDAPC